MTTTKSAKKRLSLHALAEVVKAQQAVIDALGPQEARVEELRAHAKACCREHLGD